MKPELGWGAAAAVAIVAALGISSQPGSKPPASAAGAPQVAKSGVQPKALKSAPKGQCADSISLLDHFFLHQKIAAPDECYQPADEAKRDPDFDPSFVIATFPDPLHTHFSLLFDRFIEAIQEGAQDEGYEYDSSWLPWETEEPSLSSLPDQDQAQDRKEKREDQPGILLFRKTSEGPAPPDAPYKNALIVFIVGEEPTRGIHRTQFENAVKWIEAFQEHGPKNPPVAILGPSFSGSLPSLRQLLSSDKLASKFNGAAKLAIYSGSVTSREDGSQFAKETSNVDFRSFQQNDETALDLLCRYMSRYGDGDVPNFAILSEDETAYGSTAATKTAATKTVGVRAGRPICQDATWIYYPRDISTLRAAYQSQSMFSATSTQQNQDNSQRKSLPTDLADPGGEQHDMVKTYAGNQTPLSQEAQLLGIVDALRVHHAQYVVLRSSNTLDPLFLANFLHRNYPEAREVIDNSDLLFQRGQDAMALSGVMTLSTFPLFAKATDWTALLPDEHSYRVFPENSTEATYIASRLLLQSMVRARGGTPNLNCELGDDKVFVPSLRCRVKSLGLEAVKPYVPHVPLPDYAPPYWTESKPCEPNSPGSLCRPATWLSVITRNGTWPLAALNDHTLDVQAKGTSSSWDAGCAEIPRSMLVWLIALCGFALFHFLCCRYASFTAKPAFRAHFATDYRRHTCLVLIGSYLIAQMALLTGWACGLFSRVPPSPPPNTQLVRIVIVLICVVAALSTVVNIVITKKLSGDVRSLVASSALRVIFSLVLFGILLWAFFLTWVHLIEGVLLLASRAFAYWRSMHLTSGVSPLVPFLSMTVGLYLWFWYALHGLALFGPDRPCLPPLATLGIKVPGKHVWKLAMFSQENAAVPAERISAPLAGANLTLMLVLFTGFALLVAFLLPEVPVRSLGARIYAKIYCFWLDFYFSLILAEAWQTWRTWSCTRQLLVFLDRLALRRTLSALHGFSWGNVWKMSGNVLDVRYKLLSRQLECLSHLHRSLSLFTLPESKEERDAFAGVYICLESVDASRNAGMEFAKWYSNNYNDRKAAGLDDFDAFQKQIAETTGVVLTELLIPASRVEEHSLIQVDPAKSDDDRKQGSEPSRSELIRNAEELVCLTYLGYAQNLLGRIRTIVLGGVYLFVAATIAVSSYPFDPRPLLSGVLLSIFFAFGTVVVFVYADMHRDATLSYVTNTKPGELDSAFWFKLVAYGAGPVLGLITQLFPEWAGFLFTWLQPGLSSLK